MDFTDRIRNLAPSLTVAIDGRAKQLAAEGVDIVSLGAGEPDFPTPEQISLAGIEAIRQGKTRYGAPDGLFSLKEAVCSKLLRENGLHYSPDQIVISGGAKQAVSHTIAALIGPGDEALIPAPYWVTYPELVKFYGGTARIIPTSPTERFVPCAEALEAAVTSRTKLLILNSPCNPSGTVLSRSELEAIAELCLRRNLWVLSDEIYEHLIYNGVQHLSIAQISPEMQNRTVIVNGLSKAYSMTGWRIGYTAAPVDLSRKIAAMQGQTSHHPATPSQYAAEAALQSGLETVHIMRDEFERRRNYLYSALQKIPEVELTLPEGAFYLFPSVKAYLHRTIDGQRIENSIDLCSWLLESEHLALIPGDAFGAEGFIRLSYTTSMERLEEAVVRLTRALSKLAKAT